jgi:hypothetical protein
MVLSAEEAQDQQLQSVRRLDDIWQGAEAVLTLERSGAAQAMEIRDLQRVYP